MSAVEERVVRMQFDNATFERNIANTLRQLETLNKSLQLTGATKGLQDLSAASKNVDLGHVEKGVDGISAKFKAMTVVATTALATVTHAVVSSATQMVKSFTLDPILKGFREYETNLNSIQTVLANTSKAGTTLKDVNAALAELNEYSDQTIYNFSEMAKNIGTFTAAGVKLEVATAAIKGIANLAALSGSNSQQASTAMYQLSQAISAGKVSLEDWNSVVNAGMGGKVFQDALMQTARVHGVAIDDMVKKQGSFRLTLQEGWLTGKILTDTLMQFTGDLTDAQLKAMGYSAQQIAEIQKLAQIAKGAATEVKTFTQLMNTLQEGLGSGWARTWELIFGDFDEAKKLWTGVNNVLGDFIKGSADARNKVIGDWKEMGGRTVLIEAISNAWKALMGILGPIKKSFENIFPPATGEQLYRITVAIRDFTASLIPSGDAMENLGRTFDGIFSIIGIGWDIIKELTRFLFNLFGVVTEGSGSILEFTGDIGDFFTQLRNALQEGEGLRKFFDGLTRIIEPVIRLVKNFGTMLGELFDGFDGVAAAQGLTGFIGRLASVGNFGEKLTMIWEGVISALDNVFVKFFGVAGGITGFMEGFGPKVATWFSNIDLQGIAGVLGGAGLGALLISLRGMVDGVGDILDGLTGSLNAMQNTLRAATLLQIALAVGVLTVSVVALSNIDTAALTRSLTAITVMFTQLLTAMLIFEKVSGFTGFAKMPFVAASMILLGAAINVLALAVRQLADLSWEELGRGLTGVTALMAILIATMWAMPKPQSFMLTAASLVVLGAAIHVLVGAVTDLAGLSWEEMAQGLVGVGALLAALVLFSKFAQANKLGLLSGVGILLLAGAVHILASAVEKFSEMSWAEIGRGLAAMAGALAAVGLALALVPPTAPIVAAGFLIMATSLGMIGSALEQMGSMSWGEIGKGLTVLAGALTAIGLALALVPPTAPLVAAGFLILAPALLIIGDAIKSMAEMSWEEIAKGLVTLAGALLIIGLAVTAMSGAIAGAAALLIVSASLAILAPILMAFAGMSWEEMGKGLLMLAGVFVVLGLAGLALTGLVPTLIGLGLAITLLGIGVLAAGAGVFLFATALTALAASGAAATVALVAMVGALAGLIPEVMKQIGLGIKAFAETIALAVPAMTLALVAILMSLLKAIDDVAPKLIETCYKMLNSLLQTILKYMPNMVDAGLKIVVAFLNGVANKIGDVVAAATNLAIKFLKALGDNQPKLLQEGVNYILKFLNGIADAIRANSGAMGAAGANIGTAIIEGMIRGLGGAVGKLVSAAINAAKSALNAAKNALGIKSPSKEFMKVGQYSMEGMALGLENYSKLVEKSSEDVGNRAIDTMKKTLMNMGDIISSDIDTSPTIRPVLDLTDVKTASTKMNQMLSGRTVSIDAAYSAARSISASTMIPEDTGTETSTDVPGGVTFIQNNTSPKALSPSDIYRQTKNQLSRARGVVVP